jgi:hypothetical protein
MKHGSFISSARVAALVLLLFSCGQQQDQAPPHPNLPSFTTTERSFAQDGRQYSQADLLDVRLKTTFSLQERSVRGRATIVWTAVKDGYAFFLLNALPAGSTLNGEPVEIYSLKDPDGKNDLRVIDREVKAGERYTLTLEYRMADRHVTFVPDGVRFFTSMSDITSGNFLEAFAPANFEDDSFLLSWELEIEGQAGPHRLFANGEARETGKSSWRVDFPDYYVSSSFFLHLTNTPLVVKHSVFQGITGPIPLTVYSQDAALAERAMAALPRIFAELESTYGPYTHTSFLAYISGRGGMEYCGATITSMAALAHEVTHSWFARGVMPSDGRSGWIDEAIASWRDHAYFRANSIGTRPPTNLGRFSAFERFAPANSYVDGRNFLSELDLLLAPTGGLRPLLREFYRRWQRRSVHTADFLTLLEELSGKSLKDLFDTYVFGGHGVESDSGHTHEESLHPPRLSPEEILQLR